MMIGHSTVLLRLGELNILFDPIFSERCSPFDWVGPKRVRPPALTLAELPPIDFVLVSHNHYDHCDRSTLETLAGDWDPRFIVGQGVGECLRGWGIQRITELQWWASTDLGSRDKDIPQQAVLSETGEVEDPSSQPRLTAEFVPAKHFSARGLSDRNKSLWGGFWLRWKDAAYVARADAGTDASGDSLDVYFCGDTGRDDALFSELRRRHGAPSLAFLPIGAYDPRWFMAAVHVNPEEAVEIHRTLGCKKSVGMHCATFQLTDEAMDEPEARLDSAARAAGLSREEFVPPRFGVLQRL